MIRQIDGEAIQISSWQREPGPGVPVVLWLHGAGMDRTVWTLAARDPGLRGLASLTVDLPGHGRSTGCARGSIADYAGFVASLLDALGLARVAVVGHSMGALIALEMLARRQERLSAVVLAGAAVRMPVNPALLQAASDDLPSAARMIATFAVAPAGRCAARATPGIRLGGTGVALLENSRHGVLAADLQACDRAEPSPRPAGLPCLVVSGARDRMAPAARGAELAATLGARFVRIEDAGHMAMLERPQAFADAVVPFLAEAQSRT
jgi:pimeloyl-ACP methyl ester carboxylesterase